jgi:hypothetical protein
MYILRKGTSDTFASYLQHIPLFIFYRAKNLLFNILNKIWSFNFTPSRSFLYKNIRDFKLIMGSET